MFCCCSPWDLAKCKFLLSGVRSNLFSLLANESFIPAKSTVAFSRVCPSRLWCWGCVSGEYVSRVPQFILGSSLYMFIIKKKHELLHKLILRHNKHDTSEGSAQTSQWRDYSEMWRLYCADAFCHLCRTFEMALVKEFLGQLCLNTGVILSPSAHSSSATLHKFGVFLRKLQPL